MTNKTDIVLGAYYDKKTVNRIADKLGMTPNNVKKSLLRLAATTKQDIAVLREVGIAPEVLCKDGSGIPPAFEIQPE